MKRSIVGLVVVCIAIAMGGCKNPLSQIGAGNTGDLSIVISDAVGTRTLEPPLNMTPASYTIRGVHADGETFATQVSASKASTTKSGLTFGSWTVTVDAYNDDSTPTKIGTGETTVTVVSGKTAEANIAVYPLSGKGTLDLTSSWSGTLENPSVSATLTPIAAGKPIDIPIDQTHPNYENTDLESGYYRLSFQLYDTGTLVAGAVEIVRIVAGQTTSGVVSILDAKGAGGSIAANVTIDLHSPITVSVVRASSTGATLATLGLSATQTGATGTPTFTWFVNGGPVPDGWSIDGSTLRIPAANLPEDTYRIDVLATAGNQAGSGYFIIRWQGSLGEAPNNPQANWAYYSTASGVPYYWDGTAWQTFYSDLSVTVGAGADFSTIQEAIDAPYPAGYTINVAAGTYDGTVDITKAVSLIGAGGGAKGTVLVNTAAQQDFQKLPIVPGITYGTYRPILIISASGTEEKPIVIKNISIGPRANIGYPLPAILLRPGSGEDRVASYKYISIDNVSVVGNANDYKPGSWNGGEKVNPVSGNEWGIAVDGSTSVDHLSVTNSNFTDLIYGIIFFNHYPNPSTATNVTISDSVFHHDVVKGIYVEKLSDATLQNLTVEDCGDVKHAPYYWAGYNAGIDINLKYGTFQKLSFDNLTVTGNGLDSYAGAGLTIKARGSAGDSAYSEHPAYLTGVTINGGKYTGNEVGVRFGEIVGPTYSDDGNNSNDYVDPTTFESVPLDQPASVTISGSPTISGNVKAQILNVITGLHIAEPYDKLVATSY